MYDLRLDRKLTKSMFAKWDKETKDWVVNAIASLVVVDQVVDCLLYTSPSPRDMRRSRMPSSA